MPFFMASGAMESGYPHSRLSSGMLSKFTPCTVPTGVGVKRIAASTLSQAVPGCAGA
jgi:hypothetical protein